MTKINETMVERDAVAYDAGRAQRIGDAIESRDLIAAYRKAFGVDVGRFFPDAQTALERDGEYLHYRFSSALPGDDRFYAELMQKLGYDDGNKPEFVVAARHIKDAERVLDVGCGPGRFAEHCAGADYRGIELNAEAVKEARSCGRNVALEDLDDQAREAFDVVTLFQVLEHVPDPVAFLSAAAARVSEGGLLIVSTPDMDGHIGREINHVLNYPPHHLSWWSADAITSLFDRNGFDTIDIWREPLERHHVTNLIHSILNPMTTKHFDRSLSARILSLAAKIVGKVAVRRYRPAPHLTGQCIMVVGRRRAV